MKTASLQSITLSVVDKVAVFPSVRIPLIVTGKVPALEVAEFVIVSVFVKLFKVIRLYVLVIVYSKKRGEKQYYGVLTEL